MSKASVAPRRFLGSKYMVLIAISFAVIALDQLTKMIVHSTFELDQSIKIIHGFFSLTYVRNTGAAWGILGHARYTFREIFFLSIPPLAVFIIVMFLYGLPETERVEIYALSMISGGALGNYIDRLRFGYVIDFLDFHYRNVYHYPVFNLADSSIVIGVGILTILMLKKKKTNAAVDPSRS